MSPHKMTRRALVAGIAASSTAALPSLASTPAGDDSELLRLEAEIATAGRECEATDEALAEVRRTLPDWAREPHPVRDAGDQGARACLLHAVEKDGWDQITLKAVREFNRRTEGIVEHWRDMERGPARDKMKASWVLRRAQGRERVAWWYQQMATIKAEQARAGIPELEAALERLSDWGTAIE